MTIRDDIIEELKGFIFTNDKPDNEYWIIQDVCNNGTLEQLWTLYKLSVKGNRDYTFLGFNPTDHLAITYCNMYVAILPDGSTHT